MTDNPGIRATGAITESVRTRSVLTHYDYADQFTIATNATVHETPEQWARAVLEDAAGPRGQLIWRGVLGLRLAWRNRAGHVAGWEIVDSGPTWITVAARSWMLRGNLVIEVEEGSLSLATFVRYERAIGRKIWTRVAPRHRKAAPDLLAEAQQVMRPLP